MSTSLIKVPAGGQKIVPGQATPDNPIIPFIEGDGIGVDVTPAMLNVVNAAVEKAYKGERKIAWMEIYTGEKSTHVYGEGAWLPAETLDFIREYCVAIKGPLTTPVGGGIRSLNVALRQGLDLYACIRPVRRTRTTGSEMNCSRGSVSAISLTDFFRYVMAAGSASVYRSAVSSSVPTKRETDAPSICSR